MFMATGILDRTHAETTIQPLPPFSGGQHGRADNRWPNITHNPVQRVFRHATPRAGCVSRHRPDLFSLFLLLLPLAAKNVANVPESTPACQPGLLLYYPYTTCLFPTPANGLGLGLFHFRDRNYLYVDPDRIPGSLQPRTQQPASMKAARINFDPQDFEPIKAVARTFPGTVESISHGGTPSIQVRGKLMCRLHDTGAFIPIRLNFQLRDAYVEKYPELFQVPAHFKAYPYICMSTRGYTKKLLHEILELSWRQLASKKQVMEFEGKREK